MMGKYDKTFISHYFFKVHHVCLSHVHKHMVQIPPPSQFSMMKIMHLKQYKYIFIFRREQKKSLTVSLLLVAKYKCTENL